MKAWAVAASMLVSMGCSATPAPVFSDAALMTHVRALAAPKLRGREAGTAGERRALEYVARALEAARIAPPPGSSRVQEVKLESGGASGNVLGYVPGSTGLRDEHVVIGAHVDHLGIVNGALHAGAEDNASGVAVVLEVAKRLALRRKRLGRSVVLAFFGAEEVGKQGSRAYVDAPPLPLDRLVAMVNVDMIGLPLLHMNLMWLPKLLFGIDDLRSVGIVGTEGRAGLRAVVDQGCRTGPLGAIGPEDFPDFIRDIINEQAKNRGDEASFENAGVPTVFFGSGESDDYHSPEDTTDDLRPEIMARRAAAIFETVVLLSRADWAFIRQSSSK